MTGLDPFIPYADPGPRYAGMQVRSLYIPTQDGTRLAADLYLPRGLASGERIPTLLYQTRYWCSSDLRPPLNWLVRGEGDLFPATRRGKAFFARRGYAVMVVDVRGTGASFGVSRYSWEEITVRDAYDLIEWVIAQPWSDGQVAGIGVSFLGTTAELLLATRHPALKAVIPQFNHPDPYTDIAAPGGRFNQRFIYAWTAMNEALDRSQNPAVLGFLVGLLPVSALIRRGHRIRLALAGHDEGTFPPVPAQGIPKWRVARSPRWPSALTLPIKRPGAAA